MARGMDRAQLGVTDAMLAAYGDEIFRMSHNVQVREGDPVRRLDWAEIERQREGMGLSDAQIADRLGLMREQVMFIRNSEESKRFRIGQQAYLLELGGSRRFRPERTVRLEARFRYSAAALALRSAFRFDPAQVKHFVASGWWRDDTLTKWLAHHEMTRPEAPALVHGATTVSWKRLAERVARFAEGLRRAGVARGDVVSLQLPNVPEFVIAYLAICRLGAVVSTVHMPYREAEIGTLVRHSRAVAAVCLAQAKNWLPAAAFLSCLKTVVALGPAVPGALSFAELEASAPLDRAVPAPVAADPFLLLYTSGTTAAPKAVPHNYHTMLSNARLSAPEHRLGPEDRILSAAPYAHLFGLYALHTALWTGAAQLLLAEFTPPDLAAAVAAGAPTALWTAPAHIAASRAAGILDGSVWSSLRLAIMSGSACPPELVRDLAACLPACAVTQLWGMTETQAALYSRPGDAPEVAAHSAGRSSPGNEARLADLNGQTVPAGEEGELQIRGSALFPGFYDNPEANLAAFTADGWYRTGDLARMDAAGNVAITGRLKDIINRGGAKFNPRDVEDLLAAHPKVLMAAIVPAPDPVLGERGCCFAQLRPGVEDLTLEEVVAYLAERHIAKITWPERLVLVAEMPLTPTRKIIKGRLRVPS